MIKCRNNSSCQWQFVPPEISNHSLKQLYLSKQSTTSYFNHHYPNMLSIDLNYNDWSRGNSFEAQFNLNNNQHVWVRESILKIDDNPCMEARMVGFYNNLEDEFIQNMLNLGSNSIGTVLHKFCTRSDFKFAQLGENLVRYSLFNHKNHNVLLTELFYNDFDWQ